MGKSTLIFNRPSGTKGIAGVKTPGYSQGVPMGRESEAS